MEKSLLISHQGLQIPCYVTESAGGNTRRVVLGVHGFTGSAHDDIQESIASEMSLFSSTVVRFDLPAHGSFPGDNILRLGQCRDALLGVAGWVREEYPQVEDLCIFATGFGAYVTLTVLEELLELPGRIRLVVQTPSVMMHETLLSMLGRTKDTLWAMDAVTIPTPRPVIITYDFYEELLQNVALASQPIPMLILHGEGDDFIRMEDIQNFRRINERSQMVIIPGTSHRFMEDGAWDMVLDLTRDWFSFEQVTLCDWI